MAGKNNYITNIKRDGEDTGNFRGFSLLDVGGNILAIVIDERIKEWLEGNGLYKEAQTDFRKKISTRDHIFVLNSIINKKFKRKSRKNQSGDQRIRRGCNRKIHVLQGKYLSGVDSSKHLGFFIFCRLDFLKWTRAGQEYSRLYL